MADQKFNQILNDCIFICGKTLKECKGNCIKRRDSCLGLLEYCSSLLENIRQANKKGNNDISVPYLKIVMEVINTCKEECEGTFEPLEERVRDFLFYLTKTDSTFADKA